jgi:signal transduction histidine kinase
VEINEIISVVLNIISHIFESESKKVKIIRDIEPRLPKIYADYEEIKQVLLNIVKNAFEAMPEGGQFTIRACLKPDSQENIEIAFIDNGIGIKKENLDRLFNPFFTTKIRGTGLGLAFCRRIIVERHHGKIHIESEENRGTTVKVELPIGRRSGS